MKPSKWNTLVIGMAVCAIVSSAGAQRAPDLALQKLVDSASGALARLEFKVANELIGEQRRLGQCICIDAKRNIFVTGDVPTRFPVNEMKDFMLVPAGTVSKKVKAQLLATDPEENLAFLTVTEKGKHTWTDLKFYSSSGLKLGQRVVSVGLLPPDFGNTPYLGTGLIAAKLRLPDEVIHISGGNLTVGSSPVMTLDGRVVGIVGGQLPMSTRLNLGGRWVDVAESGRQSTNFFVPTDEFAHVILNIPTPGQPRKLPWMGAVTYEPLNAEQAANMPALKGRAAVVVGQVLPDSPALKIGLKQGDTIVAFNGKPLEVLATPNLVAANFRRSLIRNAPGAKVRVTVLRKGKEYELEIGLIERPKLPHEARRYYNGKLGMAARDLVVWDKYVNRTEPLQEQGVVVTAVRQKSAADAGNLRPNDLITHVQNKPVKNVAELDKTLSPLVGDPTPIPFLVNRGGTPQAVVITPPRKTTTTPPPRR